MRRPVLPLLFGLLSVAAFPAPAAEARDEDFPKTEPVAAGIDVKALDRLRRWSELMDSDAVVVIKDGKLVVNWTFDKKTGPIEAMSATKSIVGLAVGRLIDDGRIKSLDQPVYEFYPEWNQGKKARITIRHLLNHTSGIQAFLNTAEIYASPDYIQLALAAEFSDDPGSKFAYNNKAVNLLAGIVEKSSGKRMDRYIGETIFKPMGITDFSWSLDRSGNPQAMAGLQIKALDLAKIGQMMLDRGCGKVGESSAKSGLSSRRSRARISILRCGLLWWITAQESLIADDAFVNELKTYGPEEATLEALRALKPLPDSQFWPQVSAVLAKDKILMTKLGEIDRRARQGMSPPPKRVVTGRPFGFMALGYLGNTWLSFPNERLIAVRQYRSPAEPDHKDKAKPNREPKVD